MHIRIHPEDDEWTGLDGVTGIKTVVPITPAGKRYVRRLLADIERACIRAVLAARQEETEVRITDISHRAAVMRWRRTPMRELAKLATVLARSDMRRRTHWRLLAGCDWWAVLLLTRGREGQRAEYPGAAPIRLGRAWLEKTGDGLAGEDLLYLRIAERLLAHHAHGGLTAEAAASIAASVAAELVRDGLDLTAQQ
ncbi:hypothetical protein AB0F17_62375 [Nonomuraea sp. NPDC026600]|uniref:hypothetical protein n=1 Tax=Nonomuraea sp. NPDC026600 TaxID=3155363 RepID=UPI0034079897